jgi:hypothetical protein
VVRNGYHQPREVLTSAGEVEVTVPRVNDKRTGPGTGERERYGRPGRLPLAFSTNALASIRQPAKIVSKSFRIEVGRTLQELRLPSAAGSQLSARAPIPEEERRVQARRAAAAARPLDARFDRRYWWPA